MPGQVPHFVSIDSTPMLRDEALQQFCCGSAILCIDETRHDVGIVLWIDPETNHFWGATREQWYRPAQHSTDRIKQMAQVAWRATSKWLIIRSPTAEEQKLWGG